MMCLPETSSFQLSHKSGFKNVKIADFLYISPAADSFKAGSSGSESFANITQHFNTIKLFILQSKLRHQIMDQLVQSDRRRQTGSGMSHMIRKQPRESFITWLITCIFPCSPLWQLINTSTRPIQRSSRGYLCHEERPRGFWQGHDALYFTKSQYMLSFQLQTQTYCRDNRAVIQTAGFTPFWTKDFDDLQYLVMRDF